MMDYSHHDTLTITLDDIVLQLDDIIEFMDRKGQDFETKDAMEDAKAAVIRARVRAGKSLSPA